MASDVREAQCRDCGGWFADQYSHGKRTRCYDCYPAAHLPNTSEPSEGAIQWKPAGTSYENSQRYRAPEQLRKEYRDRLEANQCPEVTPVNLPLPKSGRVVGINHVGDIHTGTDACTYDAYKQMLDFVLTHDGEYIALQGDMGDFLTAHSVGVMAEQSMHIRDQVRLITDDLKPLAKARKILWMLRGNHEERVDKATKNIVEPADWIAEQLDVRYLQTEGYTYVQCGGVGYTSYNIHGFSAGRRPGSRRNKMEDMLLRMGADVVTCGHNHHLDSIQLTTQEFNLQTMRQEIRYRWGIYTGTYHSYLGYPADAGMGAGPLGCARIELNVETGIILARTLPVVRHGGQYIQVLPA